jgi:hypothetical protein
MKYEIRTTNLLLEKVKSSSVAPSRTTENMQRSSLVTAEIIELAKSMLAKGQDWSPEADKVLSTDNSLCLCSYPDGAWIADTHGEVNMNRWTKLECVIALP